MGYLIEIDSLSCHLTYVKAEPNPPESAPAMDGEKPPLFEQVELKLEERILTLPPERRSPDPARTVKSR